MLLSLQYNSEQEVCEGAAESLWSVGVCRLRWNNRALAVTASRHPVLGGCDAEIGSRDGSSPGNAMTSGTAFSIFGLEIGVLRSI